MEEQKNNPELINIQNDSQGWNRLAVKGFIFCISPILIGTLWFLFLEATKCEVCALQALIFFPIISIILEIASLVFCIKALGVSKELKGRGLAITGIFIIFVMFILVCLLIWLIFTKPIG